MTAVAASRGGANYIELRLPLGHFANVCRLACLVGFGLCVTGILGLSWQRGWQ